MRLKKIKPAHLKTLVLLILLPTAGAATADTLDFTQAVQRALSQNPDILIAGTQIGQAEAAVRQSEGARLPKLAVSVNVTRTDDALNAFGSSCHSAAPRSTTSARANSIPPTPMSSISHRGISTIPTRSTTSIPVWKRSYRCIPAA